MTRTLWFRGLLSLALVAATAALAFSSSFYFSTIVSQFFAFALISVAIVLFRVRRSWMDAAGVALIAAIFYLPSLGLSHHRFLLVALLSFTGLACLLVLGLRAIWSEGAARKLLVMAFIPSVLFVSSDWFASTFLAWTEHAHPRVLDLFLYSFDGSLHVQFAFLLGQIFWMYPWFHLTAYLFYVALPIPIAIVYAGQLMRVRERALPAMAAFLLAGPVGILFYNLCPALGPAHIFTQAFPWHPLDTEQLRRLFLEPVALAGPRNAIPSLHMAWVLLAWWYSRGLSRLERGIVMAFLVFTVCATMGTGEHYFIDLVVAFPFSLMLEGLCEFFLPLASRPRLIAFFAGLVVTLAWLAALRFAVRAFWISPLIPWFACGATIAISIVLHKHVRAASDAARDTSALLPQTDPLTLAL